MLLLAASGIAWARWVGGPRRRRSSARSIMALVLIHPFQAMICRRSGSTGGSSGPIPWIPLSLVALFALQWLAITWGSLARLLGTRALTGADRLVLALNEVWPAALLEALKVWGRFTTMRLTDPTGATQTGPASTTTSRKN